MYERCANGKYDYKCENIFVVAFLFDNFKECQISCSCSQYQALPRMSSRDKDLSLHLS